MFSFRETPDFASKVNVTSDRRSRRHEESGVARIFRRLLEQFYLYYLGIQTSPKLVRRKDCSEVHYGHYDQFGSKLNCSWFLRSINHPNVKEMDKIHPRDVTQMRNYLFVTKTTVPYILQNLIRQILKRN